VPPPRRPALFWSPANSPFDGYLGCFPVVRRAGREVTSLILLYALVACNKKFCCYFYLLIYLILFLVSLTTRITNEVLMNVKITVFWNKRSCSFMECTNGSKVPDSYQSRVEEWAYTLLIWRLTVSPTVPVHICQINIFPQSAGTYMPN